MSTIDYKAHAIREAAAVLDRTDIATANPLSRDVLLSLMAACWLQGCSYGTHETLALAEAAFQRVRDEL